MADFDRWFLQHKNELTLKTRDQLALSAYIAGANSNKPLPILTFCGRNIDKYKLDVGLILTWDSNYNLPNASDKLFSASDLQQVINITHRINVLDWMKASEEESCLIELSVGDVIDYSTLTTAVESVKTNECTRSIIAMLERSENNIYIYEVVESLYDT